MSVTTRSAARMRSRRRMGFRGWRLTLQLRGEIDIQTRAAGHRQGLREVDTDGHDRQQHAQTDADRILNEGRTDSRARFSTRHAFGPVKAVEGVAVVEEAGDAEIPRQQADDLEGAADHVLASGLE